MPESKLDARTSRDNAPAGVRRDRAMVREAPAMTNAQAMTRVGRLADMAHQRLDFFRTIRVAIGAAQLIGESILFTGDLAVF